MIDAYDSWCQALRVSALDLNVAGSLARDLPAADFGRIVESFAADIDRLADEMEAGLRAGDSLAVRRAAHGLAGAAAAVGAATLEQAARVGLGQGPYPSGFVAAVRRTGADAMRELRALIRPRHE